MPNAQNLWHFPKKSLDTHQQDTIQCLFWNEKARQGVFLQQVTSKILEESRYTPNAAHLSFLPRTTKNLLYIRWFLDRLESHCRKKDTQHTFWKGWKECSKRWMTEDYSSTNILEVKEGSKRGNSRNASHQNQRNGRNRKICNYVVSQLLSFFHF